MTKQQQALLAAQVQRAVEIKGIIADLTDELDEIKEALDLSGLDRLEVGEHTAVKVVQQKRLFSQAEACKILGTKAEKCFYTKPSIFWKFC
jgi:hypothetical protein